jgi:hypothetical protein
MECICRFYRFAFSFIGGQVCFVVQDRGVAAFLVSVIGCWEGGEFLAPTLLAPLILCGYCA